MKVEFGGLQGSPSGTKPITARELIDYDARHVALETLKLYINLLTFSRTGDVGAPAIPYRIALDRIHTEQPDDPKVLHFPSVSVVAGEGVHDTYGLGGPNLDESTKDVFGEGTVLVALAEYQEEFNLELWGDERAQRRSLVAGMTEAFFPDETSSSLRLKLPTYYDRVASFTLMGTQYVDDPDAIRGRRRAQMRVQLAVPEVALVGYQLFYPQVIYDVVDLQVESIVALQAKLATLMTEVP